MSASDSGNVATNKSLSDTVDRRSDFATASLGDLASMGERLASLDENAVFSEEVNFENSLDRHAGVPAACDSSVADSSASAPGLVAMGVETVGKIAGKVPIVGGAATYAIDTARPIVNYVDQTAQPYIDPVQSRVSNVLYGSDTPSPNQRPKKRTGGCLRRSRTSTNLRKTRRSWIEHQLSFAVLKEFIHRQVMWVCMTIISIIKRLALIVLSQESIDSWEQYIIAHYNELSDRVKLLKYDLTLQRNYFKQVWTQRVQSCKHGVDRVFAEFSFSLWQSRMLQAVATARVSRDHVYDQLQYVLDQLRDPEVLQECAQSAWHFATHPRESFKLLQAKCQTTLQNLQQHAAQA